MKNKNRGVNIHTDTAIFCYVDTSTAEMKFGKYRNIAKEGATRRRFFEFMERKFPGLQYINFYDTASRNFVGRWSKK